MNKIKLLSAAAGLAVAAGITTAGEVVINGLKVGTYDTVTVSATDGKLTVQSSDIDPTNLEGTEGTNAAPNASFTYQCADLTCQFNGTNSSDSDGSISSYGWNFGGLATASGVGPEYTFSSAGTYTVQLTVTDNEGATDSTSQSVTVGTSGGGGDTLCSGVGIGSNGWSLDSTPSQFGSFPPPTGDTTIYSIERFKYNAIKFTGPSGYKGMVNFDENTATPNGVVTIAISRCPGDFEQELPGAKCHRASNTASLYMASTNADPALWECPLEPGETYYFNIAFGYGSGNDLSNTCESSTCGGVYTFYNK